MKTLEVTLLLLLANVLGAVEPGFYHSSSEDDQIKAGLKEIHRLMDTSDVSLWNHGGDAYDFDRPEGDVRSLPVNQLERYLREKPNKDLAVIYLSKVVMAKDELNINTKGKEIETLFKEIGYKRVLILGANSFGVIVISDSGETK